MESPTNVFRCADSGMVSMEIGLVPKWLREFEQETNYMTKVICLVCKKLKRHWLVFTSEEALKHKEETGHNKWEIYQEKG